MLHKWGRFLVAIVQQRDSKKQVAIAARDEVSAGVSDAIVDTGNVTAIETRGGMA